MNDTMQSPYLMEPAVSGALFGAVAAGRVIRRADRDYLLTPDPAAAGGEDLDVTDYMDALAGAGYVVLARDPRHLHLTGPSGVRWVLTGDGEIKASEYAVAAVNNPRTLNMVAAWAAMSGALLRLARHESPTSAQLTTVGDAHAALLLGQWALRRQVAETYRQHRQVQQMLEVWMRTFRGDSGGFTAASWEAYRILAFLRGEDLSQLETPQQLLSDDRS